MKIGLENNVKPVVLGSMEKWETEDRCKKEGDGVRAVTKRFLKQHSEWIAAWKDFIC